ncbi:MAG TPA: hypothetical protein VFD69_01935 [Vicinamibacterales bacterium]|nr:hypothetical protein [Vicinamibacterales bacterium]
MRKKFQLNRWGAALALAIFTGSCAGMAAPKTTVAEQSQVDLGALWIEPANLASRNFFDGAGGRAQAPPEAASFQVLAVDTKGYSGGYDVRDSQGVKWSVKVGKEAQPEVAVSRVLWGLGFHQPAAYVVTNWRAEGAAVPAEDLQLARFRRDTEGQEVVGDWSWYENPFVGTQPYQGLVVANLMLNNWDWKTSNNKIYNRHGEQDGPRQVYVVRDLGASLGKTSFPKFLRWTPMRGFGQGSRNDVAGFEEQGFIKGLEGQRVQFHYNGIHNKIVETVTVNDVVWTCRLMARISDEQWRDAFRAAGFTPGEQQRYVQKLKSKIRDGLALAGPA